jgi:hypothetical protein
LVEFAVVQGLDAEGPNVVLATECQLLTDKLRCGVGGDGDDSQASCTSRSG